MELHREADEDYEANEVKTTICDVTEGKQSIFEEIDRDLDDTIQQIENYKKSKQSSDDCACNPAIVYLNEKVFSILLDILDKTLFKAIETDSLKYHKSPFNPMDFIAEQLWNLNPKHPKRQDSWVSVFDMDWAKEVLKQSKRPYFPFSWIWSREYAALKIQSYMRGYWVRKREDVQEIRQFWKALQEDNTAEKELRDLNPIECECHKKEQICTNNEQ